MKKTKWGHSVEVQRLGKAIIEIVVLKEVQALLKVSVLTSTVYLLGILLKIHSRIHIFMARTVHVSKQPQLEYMGLWNILRLGFIGCLSVGCFSSQAQIREALSLCPLNFKQSPLIKNDFTGYNVIAIKLKSQYISQMLFGFQNYSLEFAFQVILQ